MIKPTVRKLLAVVAVAAVVLPASAQTPSGADLPPVDAVSMVRRVSPVYPLEALLKGKTGFAEVRFMVDYSGRPVMTTIAATNDPLFGQALLADVEANEFMPPRTNGQPQITLSSVRHEFRGEADLEPSEKRVLVELKKVKSAIVFASDLDAPLKSIRQEPPVFPFALQSDGLSGRAEIEFIVDREGRVLFPKILNTSHPDFGWSAASAVTRWRYQPPVDAGQPVDARVNVVFKFDHTKNTATW